jgi:hypothetical protein
MPTSSSFTTKPRKITRTGELQWGGDTDWSDVVTEQDDVTVNGNSIMPNQVVAPTDGLISQWKLDESTGAAIDSVGNNNGTVYNAAQGVTIDGRTAYDFNSGYLELDDEAQQYPKDDITLSMWLYPRNDTVRKQLWELNYASSSVTERNGGLLVRLASDGTVQVRISNTNNQQSHSLDTSSTLQTQEWQHLTVVKDGGSAFVYIDGEKDPSEVTGLGDLIYDYDVYDDNSVHIGDWQRDGYNDAAEYIGGMADARMYEVGLSGTKAQDLYNATKMVGE